MFIGQSSILQVLEKITEQRRVSIHPQKNISIKMFSYMELVSILHEC